uniref:Uncharacterized protein n=1 Tax=Anguilla anguilla TaxID=7936 RepID=A0A0E9X3K0_ANGAN
MNPITGGAIMCYQVLTCTSQSNDIALQCTILVFFPRKPQKLSGPGYCVGLLGLLYIIKMPIGKTQSEFNCAKHEAVFHKTAA